VINVAEREQERTMLVIITLFSAWALLLWLVVGLCASAHAGDADEAPAPRAGGPVRRGASPSGVPVRPTGRMRASGSLTPAQASLAQRELSAAAARRDDLAA
jgi:hypothetical protein